VAISYGVRRSLIKDSIYTRKLTLRGEPVPEGLRADVQFSRRAADIMRPVTPETAAAWDGTAPDGARRDYVFVPSNASLWDVIAKMTDADASVALVMSATAVPPSDGRIVLKDVRGAITRKDIVDKLAGGGELFAG
jgi:CBS domain